MSNTLKVRDLVGHDVTGIVANVTNPRYRSQYTNDPKNPNGRLRKLTCVEIRREKGKRWLYLRWERDTTDISDCGYSGWREDSSEDPTIEVQP